MTTIQKINENSYLLIDDDNEIIIDKIKMTSDGYLHIPENSSGRKLINKAKIDNLEEPYELKPITKDGTHSNPVSKKSLLEYMTEEDRKLYDEIMNRAKIAYEEAHKKTPLTELEKAELRVKKALAALEALKKETGN